MAKKITGYIKLQIPGGAANPAPPVGPALGQKGVNIMEFCKQFNAKTQDAKGMIIPVVITVYADKSFTFITKVSPVPALIKKAVGIESGSGDPTVRRLLRSLRPRSRKSLRRRCRISTQSTSKPLCAWLLVLPAPWVLKWLTEAGNSPLRI